MTDLAVLGPSTDLAPAEARRRRVRPAWYGVAALFAVTALFTSTLSSFYMFTFTSCLLACLGAIALNVLLGTAGQVSIGNSAFMAVGAFVAVFCLRSHLAFPLDVIVAAAACVVAGIIVGLPALRLRGLHLALATLAAFFIVIYFGNEYQSKAKGAGAGGFSIAPLYQSKGLAGGQRYWAWTLLVLVSLLILGASRVVHEKSGRAWRIIRDHETVAPTLGIRVTQYKMLAFALTSAVIGLEGGLAAHLSGTVSTDNYTLLLAIEYIAMVLIGGLDSIVGAVIGAGLVTSLPTLVPKIVARFVGKQTATVRGPQIAQIIYGVLIIVFITSSPQGIVGWFRGLRQWPPLQRAQARLFPNSVPRPAAASRIER